MPQPDHRRHVLAPKHLHPPRHGNLILQSGHADPETGRTRQLEGQASPPIMNVNRAGRYFQRPVDKFSRNANAVAIERHSASNLHKEPPRPLRVHANATRGQDTERVLVDLLHLRLVQNIKPGLNLCHYRTLISWLPGGFLFWPACTPDRS